MNLSKSKLSKYVRKAAALKSKGSGFFYSNHCFTHLQGFVS